MFNFILKYFEAPDDNDPNFIRLVRNVLIFAIAATIAPIIIVTSADVPLATATVPALLLLTALELLALYFVFRNHVLPAKIIVPFGLIVAITLIAFSEDLVLDISVLAYPLILIVATLLQGRRATYISLPVAIVGFCILALPPLTGHSR